MCVKGKSSVTNEVDDLEVLFFVGRRVVVVVLGECVFLEQTVKS